MTEENHKRENHQTRTILGDYALHQGLDISQVLLFPTQHEL